MSGHPLSRITTSAALCCAALAILSGCTALGPDYRRPGVAAPAAFRDAVTNVAIGGEADLPWWSVFKDPVLQDLVRASLTNSYDLRIVLTRIDQASAIQSQTKSQYLPEMDYVGAGSRGQNSFLSMPTLDGGRTMNGFFGGVQAVWEIDLWGRVRRMNEAAQANLMATREGRRGVQVSLVARVAGVYFELLELDDQLAIAHRTAESYQRTYRLFEDQHASGIASKLELSRAKAAWCSVQARTPEIERQIALKENALNALLGRNPGPVTRTATLLSQDVAVHIPIGLPSTLLERRPDIRMAEQQVRAANAEIGAAIANYFPRVGLTAFYGGTSTELNKITDSHAATWSLLAGATGPIFTAGRNTGRYHQSQAACQEAVLRYQETALNAFREVSDALITRQKLEEARVHQAEAVQACRDAVQVATDRYAAGKASYYEVLEAQQQLFPAENALSMIEAQRRLAVVQLYQALGGGWTPDAPAVGEKSGANKK